MTETESRIKAIIEEVTKRSLKDVGADSDLIQDFGVDSMQRIEIIIAIEKLFQLTVTDEDANKVRTIADMSMLVEAGKKR